MHAYYADQFVLPLPEGHRFPMPKYRMLRDWLSANLPQVQMQIAPAASDGELALVHTPAYIRGISLGVEQGGLDPKIMREIGFPWSEAMAERARRSVGASVAAARAALGWLSAASRAASRDASAQGIRRQFGWRHASQLCG
jgi:acetoin utilization deacetylase AcuC-like enzyme